ncbi:MAG TPA: glycoside hydrolase family 16 protein [Gryllotalpicola sp.]
MRYDVALGSLPFHNPLIDLATAAGVTPAGLPAYTGELVFSDEFTGGGVNGDRWLNGTWDPDSMAEGAPEWQAHTVNHQVGDASNNFGWELQQYDPSAATFADGSLQLTMRAENLVPEQSAPSFPYTSGMLITSQRFATTGGFVEVRARGSGVPGSWPAAWMIPQSFAWPPEIDIWENWGQTPSSSTYGLYQLGGGHAGGNLVGDSRQFHTYGVRWVPGVSLTQYYDGVAQAPMTSNVPAEPMYLIINHAADFRAGQQPAAADMPFSAQFDYARAWALDS